LIVLVIYKIISGPAVKDLLQQLKLPPAATLKLFYYPFDWGFLSLW
jgi:hypothetical protein